jgi:hypothetical protein
MGHEDFERWVAVLRKTLAELTTQRFDYPLGVNEVRSASSSRADLPHDLTPLYAVCDGVSLPDVHIGYFIDTAVRSSSAADRGEPTRIDGIHSTAIHVFGSDGGGGRFAVGTTDGTVYYLPSSGAVRDGVFFEGKVMKARRVAGSLLDFLWLLSADVEAFIQGREDHVYIAR